MLTGLKCLSYRAQWRTPAPFGGNFVVVFNYLPVVHHLKKASITLSEYPKYNQENGISR